MKRLKKAIVKIYHAITSVRFGKGSIFFIAMTCLFLPLALLEKHEIWILKFHYNPFSKDDYFWFYSTVAQAMAALFGIGGMFAAYILQITNNNLKDSLKEARAEIEFHRPSYDTLDMIKLNDSEFLSKLEDVIKSPGTYGLKPDEVSILQNHQSNIKSGKILKSLIIGAFKTVMKFMTSVILLSLIALLFSSDLSKLTFGFIFGLFLLLLIFATVLKMVRFVQGSIRG